MRLQDSLPLRYLPPAFLDNFASFSNTVFVVREYALQMTIFPTLLNQTLD